MSDYPQEEGSIVTSIEPSAQLFLENELKATREKWGVMKREVLLWIPRLVK